MTDKVPNPGNFNPNDEYLMPEEASDHPAWWEEHLGCAEDSHKRYKICQECPNFINLTKQCKLCNCFMFVKCRIPSSRCPDKPPRWGPCQSINVLTKNSPHYNINSLNAHLDPNDPKWMDNGESLIDPHSGIKRPLQ